MKYILAVMLISTALLGCTGSKVIEKSTSVVNASGYMQPDNYTLVYSIPKTTLEISVTARETITRRGPYYQYAERFLGISGVPSQDFTSWTIENVEINSYEEADPDHYYTLTTNDSSVTNYFRLSEEGFILPVNQRQLPELESNMRAGKISHDGPLYTDLSVNPNVVEETHTVMRRERQDTSFINVPVMQRQSVTRSLEAKAAEAADFIYELRNSRFRVISGELDLFPDGEATEAIIKEFARLEKEYISLFTGKIIEKEHEFRFEHSPGTAAVQNGIERRILFRLSDSEGVLPENNVSGRPIAIEIQNELKTTAIDRLSDQPESDAGSGRLYYRIPDVAGVQLTDGNNIIVSKRVLVSQYGKIVSIPVNFLWEEE